MDNYYNCQLCPKDCGINRNRSVLGFCGMSEKTHVASAVLHTGEEPPLISGSGSGAVFFSGCTLGCPFCQNDQISNKKMGVEVSNNELADIFLKLQKKGASNINLVTATQFTPSVIEAVKLAKNKGLIIPVLWNSSGYEKVETVDLLSKTVDVWLPDLKTLDQKLADRLFNASEYPQMAKDAITQMALWVEKNGGPLVEDGVMRRGVILRHLVIPGELESTREVIAWYSEKLSNIAILSLMFQYTPVNDAGRLIAPDGYVMPKKIYDSIIDMLYYYQIDNGYIQEPEASSKEWIPDFSKKNPFPKEFSKPVWHWK